LESLRSYNFDLAFSEQLDLCGAGIIRYLGIKHHIWLLSMPIIQGVAHDIGEMTTNTVSRVGKFLPGLPSPPSYVPAVLDLDVNDQMNWFQRVYNLFQAKI
jgi:hypothetical protein